MWRVDSDDAEPTGWFDSPIEAIREKLRRVELRQAKRPERLRDLPIFGVVAWFDSFDYELHNQGRAA